VFLLIRYSKYSATLSKIQTTFSAILPTRMLVMLEVLVKHQSVLVLVLLLKMLDLNEVPAREKNLNLTVFSFGCTFFQVKAITNNANG